EVQRVVAVVIILSAFERLFARGIYELFDEGHWKGQDDHVRFRAAFCKRRKLRYDQFDSVPNRLIVSANPFNLVNLPPRKHGPRLVRQLKLTAERILITQAGEVRVEIDELLVLAFDAPRGLCKKFGEAADGVFCADDPNAHNVTRSRLKRPVLAQTLPG